MMTDPQVLRDWLEVTEDLGHPAMQQLGLGGQLQQEQQQLGGTCRSSSLNKKRGRELHSSSNRTRRRTGYSYS